MSLREIKNGVIKSVSIGYDHGCLTAWLYLDHENGSQGFGGYALDSPPESREGSGRIPTVFAGYFINRVLETVGVDSWEKLPGRSIRVDADYGKVHRIGNFLKDKWFDPAAEFEELRDS